MAAANSKPKEAVETVRAQVQQFADELSIGRKMS
jgi:hypothetical protein